MILREKFICLLDNDPLKKADAIILLQGDGINRVPQAIHLFKNRWAKYIVLSGDAEDLSYGSFPASQIFDELIKNGVPNKLIIRESKSKNTKEQAVEVMQIIKKKKWGKIILVASHYHQYRAFLTFLQAMKDIKLKIVIINSSACNLTWFADNVWGKRIDLLEQEFKKIEKYIKKGDVASFKDAMDYFEWKEQQA